jgi:hypothetical protein
MTTLGVNVGDEFIREGICSFLDEIFGSWTPFYVNKHDLPSLQELRLDEPAVLEDKFRDSDIIVQAGAPVYWKLNGGTSYSVEWAEELWEKRIFALGPQKVVLNVSAGACQPYPDFAGTFLSDPRCVEFARRAAAACRWTSVRDPLASQILYALGIEHEPLPCAAFHAARRSNLKGTFGRGVVAVNFMPYGGHLRLRDDIDEHAWDVTCRELINSLRKHHRILFVAHDIPETAFMERYREPGEVIFRSGSWRDYLPVYARSEAVVANRVHGAVCAAGFGRPAVIIGNDTRLQIGDYIGIPSLYVMEAKADRLVDLIEDGIRGQKAEAERLIHLREESATRYRTAIADGIFRTSSGLGNERTAGQDDPVRGPKRFSLAGEAEARSGLFQDFMNTLNCFAKRMGLRQLSTGLEGWEHPWLWFNAFSGTEDWRKVRLLNIGSDLNPMPWFLASLGANVEFAGKEGLRTEAWEEIRDRSGLKVGRQAPVDKKIRIPEGLFDVVMYFSCVESGAEMRVIVSEAAGALREGGLFLVSARLRPPSWGIDFPGPNSRTPAIKKYRAILEHPAFERMPDWRPSRDDMLVEKDSRFPRPVTAGAAVLRKK